MINWDSWQKNLGVSFKDRSLLRQAFVHSSYLNENPDLPLPNNERLEFLGDAVLELAVTETLYKKFPDLPEGELTTIRACLVCRDTLAELAASLRLGDCLMLGQGEEASGGRVRQSNLANAIEALIGAIYLDQGLARAKQFILRQLKPKLEEIKAGELTPNYKSLLQEFVQREKKTTPLYQLVEASGPDHNRQFAVEILIEGEVLGKGLGRSKKIAEMEAARSAWEKLRCYYGQTRLQTQGSQKT